MNFSTHAPAEFCALTDSLASRIRWRMRDYEAFLKAQLEILAESDSAELQRFGARRILHN
jgi:hypothetical protein